MTATTTNLGMTVYDDADDPTVKAWRDTINKNDTSSAFYKIDTYLGIAKTGWIPVSSTWSYASATTITVPSGAASIYKVGQGIRLTQTSVKYFYVIDVADTVLTITGGSDYTLTNAAISAISYTNTPSTAIGFPNGFTSNSILLKMDGKTIIQSGSQSCTMVSGQRILTATTVNFPVSYTSLSGVFFTIASTNALAGTEMPLQVFPSNATTSSFTPLLAAYASVAADRTVDVRWMAVGTL